MWPLDWDTANDWTRQRTPGGRGGQTLWSGQDVPWQNTGGPVTCSLVVSSPSCANVALKTAEDDLGKYDVSLSMQSEITFS